jgi:hypothetical protein
LMRTLGLLILLLPFALYGWWMAKRQWEFKRPLLGALIYLAVYYALFFGRGNTLSFSTFYAGNDFVNSFTALTTDAIVALLVAAVAVGAFSGTTSHRTTAINSLNTGIFVAAALWMQIAIFYWLYDFTSSWFLPDLTRIFVYNLAISQSGAFMPSNLPLPFIVLLPLLAVGTKSMLRRLRHQYARHPKLQL